MVLTCNDTFDASGYNKWFEEVASFELSDFQKWAIKGIVDENHVLITAHTGSGKTLPAEFMIRYHTDLADKDGRPRKRVIYASPIKALSNQKLHDLRKKYPDVTFGLLTGDCKDNPEADVLIMTTEILRNTLFNKQIAHKSDTHMPLSFEMDIATELGGVVFDEVHYINDPQRGSVWEQSIMLLPPHIQILMLSATIDSPHTFAQWIEDEKRFASEKLELKPKTVVLAPTYERVVPLYHYMWMGVQDNVLNKLKNKEDAIVFKLKTSQLLPIKYNDNYNENTHLSVKKMKDYIWSNRLRVQRPFVMNNLVQYLKSEKLLPAICFVFSRKHAELAAKEIKLNLFEEGETHCSTVEQECKKMLMKKLSNYKEYIELPEYRDMISLLEKGIAVHHAGILPVIREMIEMLFEKGYVRLLFATETFAVGINMPTKTVIFTSLIKFDGNCLRNLYPHEYTQMAGRAGRRGLDKKGVVIHCNNLFNLPTSTEYKQILCGRPQSIRSKFNISYGLLLSVIASGATNFDNVEAFVNQSLVKREINADVYSRDRLILKIKKEISNSCEASENMLTDKKIIEEYLELEKQIQMVKPKKRKHMKQQLIQMEDETRTLKRDLEKVKHIMTLEQDTRNMSQERDSVNEYLRSEIEKVALILQEKEFIEKNNDMFSLTAIGRSASQFQESHPLALSNILHNTDMFKVFSAADIACLLSMFTNIRIPDEFKSHTPNTFVNHIDEAAIAYSNFIVHYENMELSKHLQMNETRDFTFDIMQDVMTWCNDVHDAPSCHLLIESIKNRGIFLGDFVKAILKINNVAAEIEKAAEIENNIPLLEKLKEIPLLTLKYVVSNQSLYI